MSCPARKTHKSEPGEALPALKNKPSTSLLESLPEDVHYEIFGYLLGPLSYYRYNLRPKDSDHLNGLYELNWDREILTHHPFYKLAASSHKLRECVEQFCKHMLKISEPYLNFTIPEYGAEQPLLGKINPPYRLMWVRWTYCRCMFCGKPSQRRAIWHYMMWACHKCDKKAWPKRNESDIIKSEMLLQVHLKQPHLVFPDSGLKPLPYAYDSNFGIVYLKKDVDVLVKYVREYDPHLVVSEAIQKRVNSTPVITAQDGTRIELATL